MNKFKVHILGCGSALPTVNHLPTSQVLDIRGKLMMIDCGEGSQRQFRIMHLNFSRIINIFISHLHGDHCFGLPGMLSTMGLVGRTNRLNIFGPIGLKSFIDSFLSIFGQYINYEIEVIELPHESGVVAFEDKSCVVHTLQLNHRITTIGYVFSEKVANRHLVKDMISFYNVPISMYKDIINGADFVTESGMIIKNNRLTRDGTPSRKYAFLSDTTYQPSLLPFLDDVTTMYHEATFLKVDSDRAYQTGHSTTIDAANMARKSKVNKLLIGHYSARYNNTKTFEFEAKEIFLDTIAVQEGDTFDI